MGQECEEITGLLARARNGERQPLAEVFQALYAELHRIAVARVGGSGATITPTVLVNELYLRLASGGLPELADRRHFFVAAAQAMRWILVDHARRAAADKRGGGLAGITLDEGLVDGADADTRILALHEGLEALEQIDPQRRQVVELRYFAGMGFAEIAELLGCSERTAKREWERARAFLHTLLQP
ncbi:MULTISPECIES: ECF-type sigma factor [Pseudoxanthomonas]|jgi:RNA polymerase sigma factor, TIGR02999 family|uniref:RNA polymerase subunit sigma n=2 Tax=Pseudoxanthomonas taiwanensis TaxID=176598 RepID=A0A921TF48_9GAMM|nr:MULTISPECIES: ECF-type sigma factor [Pseudoxanthomonas]KAF1685956.1 RNA polymerase subunit sigma [Pseudoxanthomonas taiwanensis]MBO2468115.1 RNA polymerase subunit sigma [Xanthomonadaceae bacterium]TWH09645.1 RNA polymerase sigma factor (TIGR02999 family) [Pseudoxanthomonas taiwanensis J19]